MKLISSAVKRPVTVLMIFISVILLGVVSLNSSSLSLLPNIDLPMIVVYTTYEGAGSEEVEQTVTKPLEGVLASLAGMDSIYSSSSAGTSMILVSFAWDTDMSDTLLSIRENIGLIADYLPDAVPDPMIIKLDPNMLPVMSICVSGSTDLAELKQTTDDVILPRIERISGVASVSVYGGYTNEIKVIVDPNKLANYGLSLSSVSTALAAANRNIASGSVVDGSQELMVRTMGQFASLADIEKTPIILSTGSIIYVSDIATVTEGHAAETEYIRSDGENSVVLSVNQQSDANTVEVATAVEKELTKISSELTGSVSVGIIFNQADYIRFSIEGIIVSAIFGAFLAMLVLFLFLRNLRSTLIIAFSIPISLIGTFILIYFNGMTLNMMTLGGLVLGLGMMVDASIVILEGIARKQEEGMPPKAAAIAGGNELALAVIASTLTTVAVFLPVAFTQGITSIIFKDLALTIVFSLLVSLLVSLTLVPMLSTYLLRPERASTSSEGIRSILNKSKVRMGHFVKWLDEKYRKILTWGLAHRKKVVIITVLSFLIAVALAPVVGAEFLPYSDGGELNIVMTMPDGSNINSTDQLALEVEGLIAEELGDDVQNIFTMVGASSNSFSSGTTTDSAEIRVMLVSSSERKISSKEAADTLRKRLNRIPDATFTVTAVNAMGFSSLTSGSDISVEIKGEDIEVLENLSAEVFDIVSGVEGTREVASSLEAGRPELHLTVNQAKIAQYGLTVSQIAPLIRAGLSGVVAGQYRSSSTGEIDIVVQIPEEYSYDVNDLQQIIIATPIGVNIPLGDLVTIKRSEGPTSIIRSDQARTVTISCDILARDLKSVAKDIQTEIDKIALASGYTINISGENEQMLESFSSLYLALVLAVVLVYMVMASLFESFIYPFIIMFSMPTTFVGVILSLVITGRTLNVSSLIGIIMLVGIVVNNGIVLVDYINRLRKEGKNREDAILQAGPTRLRPILMTTLTTVLGMLPLAFGFGEGSEMRTPMSTVVIGGLLVSTIFTLVFVPVMYTLMDDFSAFVRHKLGLKIKEYKEDENVEVSEPETEVL